MLLASGVGALSAARAVGAGGDHIGSAAYWPAAAAIGFIALLLVRAGLRRTGQRRATLTGLAAGQIWGISDALTRSTLLLLDRHGIVAVLNQPARRSSLAAAALLALWLMESSFSAAPLHASLPGITAGEPVVGILLGVVVFGDVIRITPTQIALQAAGIVALVAGVILVARAPALSDIRAKGVGLRHTATEDLRRTAGRVLPGPKVADAVPDRAADVPRHPEGVWVEPGRPPGPAGFLVQVRLGRRMTWLGADHRAWRALERRVLVTAERRLRAARGPPGWAARGPGIGGTTHRVDGGPPCRYRIAAIASRPAAHFRIARARHVVVTAGGQSGYRPAGTWRAPATARAATAAPQLAARCSSTGAARLPERSRSQDRQRACRRHPGRDRCNGAEPSPGGWPSPG